jgi:hypothetical protein
MVFLKPPYREALKNTTNQEKTRAEGDMRYCTFIDLVKKYLKLFIELPLQSNAQKRKKKNAEKTEDARLVGSSKANQIYAEVSGFFFRDAF